MTTIQTIVTACMLSLLLGLGGGWYVHGKFDQAALTKEMKAQIDQANKAADKRVQDELTAKADTERDLAGEQAKTKDLNSKLDELRSTNTSLMDKISHANFTRAVISVPASPAGGPAHSCPGPAIGSPEFVRLYGAAAQGGTPGAEGGTGDPGGVP